MKSTYFDYIAIFDDKVNMDISKKIYKQCFYDD